MTKDYLLGFCKRAQERGFDVKATLRKVAAAAPVAAQAPVAKPKAVANPVPKTPSAPQFSNALPVKPPQVKTPAVPAPAPLFGKASEAYIAGFAKAAEAYGADPQALLQKEAKGRIPVQALLRMILPKASSARQLVSNKANVNRNPLSMLTRGGRDRALRDAREHFSWFSDGGVRSADNLQLLRQMNGNKGALTDAMKAQMADQQTAGKAYNLINALVGRKLQAPK